MEKKTMGTFIAALRRAQGLTQQEVADRLLVSNRAVSRWERDEAAPDISLLPAIGELFGVTVDELLRGERKKIGESPSPDIGPEGDAIAHTPDPLDPRAQRGMRALCRRERTRLENHIWLSVALAIAGYIILIGIAYGYYRPIVGFAGLCLFCIGSAVISFLALTRMREVLSEQAAEDIPRLPEGDLAALLDTYLRGGYAAVLAPTAVLLTGAPLMLIRPVQSISGYLSADVYVWVAIAVSAAVGVLGWALYRPIWRRRVSVWAGRFAPLRLSAPLPPTPERLYGLNLWQWGCAAVGVGGGVTVGLIGEVNGVLHDGTPWVVPLGRALAVLLVAAGLFGTVLVPILYARRTRSGDRTARAHIRISGIRNAVIIALSTVFAVSGLLVAYSGNGIWRLTFRWSPAAIAFFAAVVLSLFAAAEVIRRYTAAK